MFGELLSKSLLRGSQTELSDLINQRGINSDFNTTGILLNDERNDERSQEIAAAYSKFFVGSSLASFTLF